jgi:hypothetical protein
MIRTVRRVPARTSDGAGPEVRGFIAPDPPGRISALICEVKRMRSFTRRGRRDCRPAGPNAVVFLWTEPAWSLAMAWQASYLTVYLVAQGLSPAGVGAAVGAAALVQVAGLLASGWMADHLGRKTVIMAGDFVAWVLALGLWVLDPRPLVLALGVVLLNGFAFVAPAWNSLFSEDVEPRRVSFYYLMLQQLTLFGGLAIPLMAPLVHRWGVRVSGHWALAIAWPLVTVAWVLRLLWLKESTVGQALRVARRSGRHGSLRDRLVSGLAGANRLLAVLRILLTVAITLWATFAPLVLVARRAEALSPALLAFLPLGSTVAGISVLLLERRWRTAPPGVAMSVALALMALGMGGVSLAPAHAFVPVLTAWTLVAAGQAMFWTVHTTLWMAFLPDRSRVEVQGWVGASSAVLVAVLAPLLARWLPRLPRMVNAIWALMVVVALLMVLGWGRYLLPVRRRTV